jgi:hypothetical protein
MNGRGRMGQRMMPGPGLLDDDLDLEDEDGSDPVPPGGAR